MRRMRVRKGRVAMGCVLAAVHFFCGCGYTARPNFLPKHISTVYIDTFFNNTDQQGLENEFRAALTRMIQQDGNLQLVDRERAAAVIQGRMAAYTRQPLRYNDDETVREYRVVVVVDFEFIDQVNKQPVVQEKNFAGDAAYYLSGSLAGSEASAREAAVQDLSRRLLNRVFTLW
ncbi:MAG: LPS assembly lipoprotein LptE [Candidatus Omnitrophica bacterium]|nr:LPS assembly lipoprotein LptE [Candidatus Omnitrophota bacterium]